jgi:hypothetical protein
MGKVQGQGMVERRGRAGGGSALCVRIFHATRRNAAVPKLEAEIRECAAVKYLVATLCEDRREKAKK